MRYLPSGLSGSPPGIDVIGLAVALQMFLVDVVGQRTQVGSLVLPRILKAPTGVFQSNRPRPTGNV